LKERTLDYVRGARFNSDQTIAPLEGYEDRGGVYIAFETTIPHYYKILEDYAIPLKQPTTSVLLLLT
jgi:hypothetical protein